MVDFPIDTDIVPIGDSVFNLQRDAGLEWFAEDITILLSSDKNITTIVIDFSFDESSIIQYTLDGVIFQSFNQGTAVEGGQSRFIRVTTDTKLNFKALSEGTLNRCIVSVP